jgi:hypothetical protein
LSNLKDKVLSRIGKEIFVLQILKEKTCLNELLKKGLSESERSKKVSKETFKKGFLYENSTLKN